MHRKDNCTLCKPVNFVCFWGEMPVRPWKRAALLVISGAIAALFVALWWLAEGPQDWGERVAVLVGALFGIAGISVALFGCDKCAARVFSNV